MVTGEIKNKIDQIWDTFFVAGITNPITVLEQMTYIFFMKMLDDKQLQEDLKKRKSCCGSSTAQIGKSPCASNLKSSPLCAGKSLLLLFNKSDLIGLNDLAHPTGPNGTNVPKALYCP